MHKRSFTITLSGLPPLNIEVEGLAGLQHKALQTVMKRHRPEWFHCEPRMEGPYISRVEIYRAEGNALVESEVIWIRETTYDEPY